MPILGSVGQVGNLSYGRFFLNSATFRSVSSGFFSAALSQPLQQTNTGVPLSMTLIGTPIEPSGSSVTGQNLLRHRQRAIRGRQLGQRGRDLVVLVLRRARSNRAGLPAAEPPM